MKTQPKSPFWRVAQTVLLSATCILLASCENDVRTDGYETNSIPELLPLSAEQKAVIDYLPKNVIIAHRGSEFWAPEESEAAMRWARNMGADYLEIDLQRTKDGVLLALHDESLLRTTDVAIKFPNEKNNYTSSFTYDQLLTLDIGSWFNDANPMQARNSFVGLDVITLDDVIKIAEGKRIKRDANGKRMVNRDENGKYVSTIYEEDPADNGNRPGVYIETKAPYMFGGIEKDLAACLTKAGWYHDDIKQMKVIPYKNGVKGDVDIANTPARIILQTFDNNSLDLLRKAFNRLVPTLYLYADIGGNAITYAEKINFAIKTGATIMGPNIDYVTGYPSSLMIWQGDMIRRSGLDIHAWSFNTQEQLLKYSGPWADPDGKGGPEKNYLDGSFTNLTDMSVNFYRTTLEGYKTKGKNYFQSNAKVGLPDNIHLNKRVQTAQQVLVDLGY